MGLRKTLRPQEKKMSVWWVLATKASHSLRKRIYIRGGPRTVQVAWENQKSLLALDRAIQVGMKLYLQSLHGLLKTTWGEECLCVPTQGCQGAITATLLPVTPVVLALRKSHGTSTQPGEGAAGGKNLSVLRYSFASTANWEIKTEIQLSLGKIYKIIIHAHLNL